MNKNQFLDLVNQMLKLMIKNQKENEKDKKK